GLYVVGTPIGNLEDITLRALRILKEVDLIACEDTRHTQKLLNHFSIAKRTVSYHEHNEAGRAAQLVEDLGAGARIALVTDAGMPGISDPGYRLVNAAIQRGIPVVPVPGAAAFMLALVASGLPTDVFRFSGFVPPREGARKRAFADIRQSEQTEVFYEAPHRLAETLQSVVEELGAERVVVVARELTKLHEEVIRGTAAEVLSRLQTTEVKGEITLLIGRAEDGIMPDSVPVSVSERVRQLLDEENMSEKEALKKIAKERGISKSEVYRELQRGRG
nr:16S rRNA (cytidine(1402)-2'-O)-methyltransferase [Terriglobales bacterium]